MTDVSVRPAEPRHETRHETRPRRRPPRRRGNNPVLGSGIEFWRRPIPLMHSLLERYPDIVQVRLGFDDVHFVHSPELARRVLAQSNRNYVGFPTVMRSIESIGGENLFTSQGEAWREQRTMLQPAFHRRTVSGFAEIMTQEADRAIEVFSAASGPVSIADAMQDVTFNVFARSLFSTNLAGDGRMRADYARAASYISYRIEHPFAPPLAIPTLGNIGINAAVWRASQHLEGLLSERRAQGAHAPDDFLQMLLETRYEDGSPLEDQAILNQSKMFLFGGNGPPARILTWALYHLAKHPDVEARLHEELERELGGRQPTVEDLPRLTWTQMIIDELLRLFPTAWALPRTCVDGDDLGGYRIDKGEGVWVMLYSMHRHPDFWDRPNEFDPERFAPDAVAARTSSAYLPWGAGPRMCIAMAMATMHMKLVLATICQQYRFTCPDEYVARPKIGFPLGPAGPVPMTPVRRA